MKLFELDSWGMWVAAKIIYFPSFDKKLLISGWYNAMYWLLTNQFYYISCVEQLTAIYQGLCIYYMDWCINICHQHSSSLHSTRWFSKIITLKQDEKAGFQSKVRCLFPFLKTWDKISPLIILERYQREIVHLHTIYLQFFISKLSCHHSF